MKFVLLGFLFKQASFLNLLNPFINSILNLTDLFFKQLICLNLMVLTLSKDMVYSQHDGLDKILNNHSTCYTMFINCLYLDPSEHKR